MAAARLLFSAPGQAAHTVARLPVAAPFTLLLGCHSALLLSSARMAMVTAMAQDAPLELIATTMTLQGLVTAQRLPLHHQAAAEVLVAVVAVLSRRRR